MVSFEEAKQYLKVDTDYDDELIRRLLKNAKQIVTDVLRVEKIADIEEKEVLRIAILYTLSYLYDERGNANFKNLMLDLRALLQSHRRAIF